MADLEEFKWGKGGKAKTIEPYLVGKGDWRSRGGICLVF